MNVRVERSAVCVALLLSVLLAGCGKSSSSGQDSSNNSSGEKSKTYTPNGKDSKGASSGGAALPIQADTINGRPSATSDAGSADATKGQVVMNPGAPAAHSSKQH